MGFMSVLGYAKHLAKERLQPGDRAIDATVGNGNDTLFMAEQVGKRGVVYGFDVQQAAIDSTKERFLRAGRDMEGVQLFLASHDRMPEYIPERDHGRIAAVMFNLGYLPGADQSVITHTETTLGALQAALALLRPRGIVTAVLYPGHAGGDAEAASVETWAASLQSDQYHTLCYRFLNKSRAAPYLLAIEKRGG